MMVMGEGNKIVEREEYKILEVKARHFNVIRVGREDSFSLIQLLFGIWNLSMISLYSTGRNTTFDRVEILHP
jgi:hypothetical protein